MSHSPLVVTARVQSAAFFGLFLFYLLAYAPIYKFCCLLESVLVGTRSNHYHYILVTPFLVNVQSTQAGAGIGCLTGLDS